MILLNKNISKKQKFYEKKFFHKNTKNVVPYLCQSYGTTFFEKQIRICNICVSQL